MLAERSAGVDFRSRIHQHRLIVHDGQVGSHVVVIVLLGVMPALHRYRQPAAFVLAGSVDQHAALIKPRPLRGTGLSRAPFLSDTLLGIANTIVQYNGAVDHTAPACSAAAASEDSIVA